MRSAEDSYQRDADIVRARYLLEWARIIEAYHKKSGYYPLQRRVKGEDAIRVVIATREQQAQLSAQLLEAPATVIAHRRARERWR